MKLYNTLSRQMTALVPREAGHFRMYSCGPTVYRSIHIGNLRTFTMADWLRRSLTYSGYQVTHVKNITDVGHMRVELLDAGEDKVEAQARKEGKTSTEIAAFYTAGFLADEAALNILPAHVFPRATQHIPQMLAIIEGLVAKEVAYVVEGNVFFDITRFAGYGTLSGNVQAGLIEGVRELGDVRRRHPEDFPLWKVAEPGREMAWDSVWGRGFPGWHIECSAMAMAYLGRHFDVHTGGVDNIFPHHEDERAQSEAFTGETFADTWVHAQHLLVDGMKMAKSTGNAYTLDEIRALGYDPLALRFFFTTAHYRSRINFTFAALRAAEIGLNRLRAKVARLAVTPDAAETSTDGRAYEEAFRAELDDDLNLPRAMALVWRMLRDTRLSAATRVATMLRWDEILGFSLRAYIESGDWQQQNDPAYSLAHAPASLRPFVERRQAARQAGDFATADALRADIADAGYAVRDMPSGTLVVARRADEGFATIGRSADTPDKTALPDHATFAVNLIARNNRADLERCIASLVRHRAGHNLELVIIDDGSIDDTAAYLRSIARTGIGDPAIQTTILFADHTLGFAAARNATTRASQSCYVVWMDTSIEVEADIWTELEQTLAEKEVGIAGPYGLLTQDLREFQEATATRAADVDAIEGYLLAFRRALWPEVGPLDEKFRFYRLADIYLSFFFKSAGYRAVVLPDVAALLTKHPHREWYSLSAEEQRTKSKKNYDIFRDRWHHGQSLTVAGFVAANRWFGHDQPQHIGGTHMHQPDELPPSGQSHSHTHHHWPDHDHSHPHFHNPA